MARRKSRKRNNKKRRKTRKKSAGMYNIQERERLKAIGKSIPLSILIKTKHMTPKQKIAAFKKIGIKERDIKALAQMQRDESAEKKALIAHRKMMQQEAIIKGGKRSKRRTRRRRLRRSVKSKKMYKK